jgi:hypothetical protein
MPEQIGPHLLGRRPSPPDPRDWKISELPWRIAMLPKRKLSWWEAIWAWLVSLFGEPPVPPAPPGPSPTPVAPPSSNVWGDPIQLDQGQTPHCVGFGWAGWGDALPVQDALQDADGHAIYYECKVIDGEPRQEDGSDVRSGAKAMKNRGRLSAYLFASTIDEIKQWLLTRGSVVFGTDWTDTMFNPNGAGYISPANGTVQGGHCYVCLGYDGPTDTYFFQNSWGSSWGLEGRFKMLGADVQKLIFGSSGEACVALELA